MTTKIQIKSTKGEVLFEHETEENTVRKTVEAAVKAGVNLSGASLIDASLLGANLSGANLSLLPDSYINDCSQNILFILLSARQEVSFLKDKLLKGDIDGTQYEGECCCLIGSLAKGSSQSVDQVCSTIPFYKKGIHNPGESWFLNIRKGDTPENNQFAAHVLKLIELVESGRFDK